MACDCQCWGCVSGDYHCDSVRCNPKKWARSRGFEIGEKKRPKKPARAADPPKVR